MTTVGQLGTFDLENYGDLLYPIVFRHVLKRCEARLTVRPYSFLNVNAPQGAGFVTTALTDLFDPDYSSSIRLIIGGGDLLRTDWNLVAAHYREAYRGYYRRLLNSLGTVNSFHYLLRKRLSPVEGFNFYADQFRAQWMDHAGVGPFLIDPDALPKDSLICYLSCGVPHEFAPGEMSQVSRILDKARFIYLRDEQSFNKLKRAGVSREMRVAPDLIVTLSDFFDHATEAQRGRRILSELGVDADGSVLCFQAQPAAQISQDEIIAQLLRYRERTHSEIILLPLAYCHRDHIFLRELAKKSGGAFKYIDVYSVYDMISVIAACSIFVGTSLHGNITAFSFGIPHLYGKLNVDKAEGFIHAVGLPAELKLQAWSEMNDKLDMVAAMGTVFFSERAEKAKTKVYRVVSDLLDELLKGDARLKSVSSSSLSTDTSAHVENKAPVRADQKALILDHPSGGSEPSL